MTERNQLILGLAWPVVVLIAIGLAFFAFRIVCKTSACSVIPPSQAVSPQPGSQNETPQSERRVIWWATFTAVTATVLALALRNPNQQANVWAVRFLAASLILSIAKFFHWTHDDLKYPVIGWVIQVLNRTILGPLIAALAMVGFALGLIILYRRS